MKCNWYHVFAEGDFQIENWEFAVEPGVYWIVTLTTGRTSYDDPNLRFQRYERPYKDGDALMEDAVLNYVYNGARTNIPIETYVVKLTEAPQQVRNMLDTNPVAAFAIYLVL